jgi:homoserine dehydrogenase
MTVAQIASPEVGRASSAPGTLTSIRIGLLGLGQVGSAVARLAAAPARLGRAEAEITAALVRDPLRPRETFGIRVTADAEAVFATRPSVIVEALGGLEPARTLVLEAIARGIPVVTANKSLLAHHGDELGEAAALTGVPLRFEASVLAGVPFLGTFARRPCAARLTSFTGIVNGTTNFILSQMQDGTKEFESALSEAQRRGFAEPDPSKDVEGIDAVEKLTILIRQFGGPSVEPRTIEIAGITSVTAADLRHARALGGTLKPVAHAAGLGPDRTAVAAFAGPAFLPDCHPLARVHSVANGLRLRDIAGSELCFTGPGAGPDVTAVTVLDDVLEATAPSAQIDWPATVRVGQAVPPITAWFVRVTSATALPPGADTAALLGSQGVWVERTTGRSTRDGNESLAILTYPCDRAQVERAAAAFAAATGSTTNIFRALDARA